MMDRIVLAEDEANSQEIPHDWSLVPLNDLRTFSTSPGLWTGKKPPFVSARVIRNTNFRDDGQIDFSDVAELNVEERHLAAKELRPGDIIIERSGGGPRQPVGRVVLFDRSDSNFSFSNFTARLRVEDSARMMPQFVLYSLLRFHVNGGTETLQRRTTGIRNLDFTDYLKTRIPCPPIGEQRAIVAVLGKLQAAVAAQQAIIDRTVELKAALMAKVFAEGTRGEPQKDSETGLIPESWRACRLGELIADGPQNGVYKPASLYGRGTAILRIDDFENEGSIVTKAANCVELVADDVARYGLRHLDIVINRVNSLSHLGKTALVGELEQPTVFESNMMRFRTDDSSVEPRFVFRFLTSEGCRNYFRGTAKRAVAQSSINQTDVMSVPIPIPPRDVQIEIANLLDQIDCASDAATAKKRLSEELFSAMLDELMTGRIRAHDLDLAETR